MPYRRGPLWYCDIRYTDPQSGQSVRLRRSLGSNIRTKRAAVAAEQALLIELSGTSSDPVGTPGSVDADLPEAYLFGLADLWLSDEIKPHKKPGTYESYESIIRVHIKPFFGDEPIGALTIRDIDRFSAELRRKKLSANRLNAILTVLSGLCSTAVRWGYLRQNPCKDIRWAKTEESEEFIWFDALQQSIFLETCKRLHPEIWRLFLLGFAAGLRPGEAVAARDGDLDLVRGSIHVQRTVNRAGTVNLPKSNKKRRIPLPSVAVQQLRASRHLNGELVSPSPSGEMWTEAEKRWRWNRVCKAAGLPFCGPHTMRHSYASQLVSAGVSLYTVQKLLGHTTPRQTQRYAHLAPDATQAAVEHLFRGSESDFGHTLDTPAPTRTNNKP